MFENNTQILALDMATKTGWASQGMSGVQEFTLNRGESPGMRFLRFRAWLNNMYSLIPGLNVIVYEQAHHRGGYATSLCVGLVTETLAFAADKNIETMPVHSATLKKWATGKGNANKDAMMKAAKKFGHDPKDDNEADAILLYKYAESTLGV